MDDLEDEKDETDWDDIRFLILMVVQLAIFGLSLVSFPSVFIAENGMLPSSK